MPIVGNFYKGLAVSVPLHLRSWAGHHAEACTRPGGAHYAGERFVRVMPLRDPATLEDRLLRRAGLQRHQPRRLFVFANEDQALLMARLDNLGKGASGAAVQAMNVHLGVDEGWGCEAHQPAVQPALDPRLRRGRRPGPFPWRALWNWGRS
jgi:N-acetyl-gamma-glutamyl-phosphate reductase